MKATKKPDGKERHLLDLIAGQERKIETCKVRIAEIQKELDEHRLSVVVPAPPKALDLTGYCGKILYTSKKSAGAAIKLINRDLRKAKKPTIKRAYFCDKCEAWHLTTIEQWLPYPETGGHVAVV